MGNTSSRGKDSLPYGRNKDEYDVIDNNGGVRLPSPRRRWRETADRDLRRDASRVEHVFRRKIVQVSPDRPRSSFVR